jgi:uncharacterized membrane protein YphA (DoxX/SURF4 family)
MTEAAPSQTAATPRLSGTQRLALTVLRMAIGWHFLYEGVVKVFTPEWSAAPYLHTATGPLAAIFQWIAASPWALALTNAFNVWGLTLIGLALVLGCGTRAASLLGIALLSMYYLAHPPLLGTDVRLPAEGHYFLVNKNLVELLALALFVVFPTGSFAGLDRLFRSLASRARGAIEPETKADVAPADSLERRQLFGNLAALPVLGFFAWGASRKREYEKVHAITGATITLKEVALEDLKGTLPSGRVGALEMTRLILGCNLIGGWSHSRDLIYVSSLFKAYNTDRKVFETIELAERAGIDTMQLVTAQYPLFHRYQKLVSRKMKTMCQVYPTEKDPLSDIDKAIDAGATTMYVQGGYAETLVKAGRIDILGRALDYMKGQGYVAGIGGHDLGVVVATEKAGLKPDYYVKTLHHDRYWSAHPRENRKPFSVDAGKSPDHDQFHDNIFDLFPEETVEYMKTIETPWVAFKILAGGAIPPPDGFRYAFENGADFICVGMFDFQVVEDVNVTLDALTTVEASASRERPWRA